MKQSINNEQLLADLFWTVNSPPIMSFDSSERFRFDAEEPWFRALKQDSTPLNDIIRQTNIHMIGPYFEALWLAFFLFNPRFRLLAKNLQVHHGGKTLGEFDFIVGDLKTQETLHLEVAVKFYLGYPPAAQAANLVDASPQSAWIGPGCNDRLDKKSTALVERQSQLAKTEPGQSALRTVGVEQPETVINLIAIRGYLFYPAIAAMAAPQNVSPNHLSGLWVRLGSAADSIIRRKQGKSLSKPWWLADLQSEAIAHNADGDKDIAVRVAARGPQLIRLEGGEKLFVVGEQWPQSSETI